MKIRDGYVSNSSSSSFVVIGKEVGNLWHDEIRFDKDKKYFMFGVYLSEGYDLIHLDAELAKWFKEHHDKNDREFIDEINGTVIESTFCTYDASGASGEELPAIPEGNKVWLETVDDHGTYDIETAGNTYYSRR